MFNPKSFLAVVVVSLLFTVAAAAQEPGIGTAELSGLSSFNRDLVGQVQQGCIYIWAMTPGDSGFLQPAWIGSGVIFMAVPEENACYALTNHHVANDTTLLQCETWDNTTYKAQMVATEPGIDCALIRIEGITRDQYEPCILGNSDLVKPGDTALAIGAPGYGDAVNTERGDPDATFGLHQSTTLKVVSGRSTNPYLFIRTWAGWKEDLGRQVMTNCPWRFVVESAISGGNSGGPLFNSQGECIGLNHAHFGGGSGLSQHENYTIPINFCKNFAFQILDTGRYELPWFGMDVLIPKHFDDGAKANEFLERHLAAGILTVFDVRKDSPAQRAGIRSGDVILEFDGKVFEDRTELRLYIFSLEVGRRVPVLLERDGEELTLVLEVGAKRNYDSEFSL